MSATETATGGQERAEARAKRPASAVTSGRKLFIEGDPNSAWSRRFRDLAGHHVADLGGTGALSAAKLSLCRRAAALECQLEAMEGTLSAGGTVDLDGFGRACSHLRRILETLGIERKASAPFLEAHVVGTPWSPMQARLRAEAEAVTAKEEAATE
jgi:hypothetical protein